jgi:flagellar M-ring protein FliF
MAMDQLKNIFGRLSLRQIATIAVALMVSVGALYSMVHWRRETDFKTLYTGLAAEDAAAVIQKLKESGTEYRLSDSGDMITVPSAKLAEQRLQLAAAGLPRTGRIGFEIFDKTNLGATEFVEHVNYGRALEGELERSVGALSEVEQARVHITFPKDSVFVESRQSAKASVMMKLKPGTRLSSRNVMAVAHLISSAVEGLTPDAVSILDMQGNLLSRPQPSSPQDAESDAALDYRQKVEHDLMQKISLTLDPLLGHDRYRASMSVDLDLTSGEQSEETVDPAKSVMLQSQKTEEMIGGSSSGGVPGTASNLPRPASRPGSSGNTTTRRTENISWQPSKVTRTTKLPQGTLKRMSVALVLDQAVKWEGTGKSIHKVVVPPSPEILKSVKDVVTAAIGFVPDRGDLITVETLPFEETLNQPPPETTPPAKPAPAAQDQWKNLMKLPLSVLIGAAVGVVLLLAGVVFLLTRRSGAKKASVEVTEEHKPLPGSPEARAIEASDVQAQLETQIAEREEEQRKADLAALASIKVPPVKTKKGEVLARQIRENTKKDSVAAANILQAWIHDR